jgi:hypothetical protein
LLIWPHFQARQPAKQGEAAWGTGCAAIAYYCKRPATQKNAVKGAIPKGTNLKNFFYLRTQPYDAPEKQMVTR